MPDYPFVQFFMQFTLTILLCIAGWHDLKKRKVDDILIAFMWIAALLAGLVNSLFYFVVIGTFALFLFLNTLYFEYKKKILYGWGDNLIYPIYMAICVMSFGLLFGVIVGLIPLLIEGWHKTICPKDKKKGRPLIFYCAVVYITELIIFSLTNI